MNEPSVRPTSSEMASPEAAPTEAAHPDASADRAWSYETAAVQTGIARGLGQSGAQATRVEFRPEGLVCRMYVPQDRVSR